MKKLIFAVMVLAVSLTSCTPDAPDAETTKCDSICVDSCSAVVPTASVTNDSTAVADTTK